jgi:hypothetical protein
MSSNSQPYQYRRARTYRFADPWSFRRNSTVRREAIADLRGRPVATRSFRRGGISMHCAIPSDVELETNHGIFIPTGERSMLVELRRRVSATVARYRLEKWCTPTELATINALWCRGLRLRQLARHDGVTPSAIVTRVEGLARKAPEFYRWWRLKHRARRASHRCE